MGSSSSPWPRASPSTARSRSIRWNGPTTRSKTCGMDASAERPSSCPTPRDANLGDPRGRLLQLALDDLAGGVARQLVDELDLAWDLEAGEVGLDVPLDVLLAELLAVPGGHEGLERLAEPVVVHADHGDLADGVVLGQEVLDLGGKHVLPAGDDHLVVATLDEQAPLLVDVADVAGGHQPAEDLLVATAGVALEQDLVAPEDAAGLARRHLAALLVEDLQHGAAR